MFVRSLKTGHLMFHSNYGPFCSRIVQLHWERRMSFVSGGSFPSQLIACRHGWSMGVADKPKPSCGFAYYNTSHSNCLRKHICWKQIGTGTLQRPAHRLALSGKILRDCARVCVCVYTHVGNNDWHPCVYVLPLTGEELLTFDDGPTKLPGSLRWPNCMHSLTRRADTCMCNVHIRVSDYIYQCKIQYIIQFLIDQVLICTQCLGCRSTKQCTIHDIFFHEKPVWTSSRERKQQSLFVFDICGQWRNSSCPSGRQRTPWCHFPLSCRHRLYEPILTAHVLLMTHEEQLTQYWLFYKKTQLLHSYHSLFAQINTNAQWEESQHTHTHT